MSALGLCNDSGKERQSRFLLPHPSITPSLFLTLEDALQTAWQRLHDSPPKGFDLNAALETEFTAELHEILQDELLTEECVPGFTREVFSAVVRPEVKNFDGKKIAKKPDILALFAGRSNVRSSQDGIFIECKPVDAKHPLESDYCDKGITRFIDGDYAWAMTEAMMVAYSREPKKPSVALADAFKNRAKKVLVVGKLRDCPASPAQPAVAISVHRRTFPLRGHRARNITLRHLWLQRPA